MRESTGPMCVILEHSHPQAEDGRPRFLSSVGATVVSWIFRGAGLIHKEQRLAEECGSPWSWPGAGPTSSSSTDLTPGAPLFMDRQVPLQVWPASNNGAQPCGTSPGGPSLCLVCDGSPHSVLDLLPSARGACGVKSSDLGPGPGLRRNQRAGRPLAGQGGSFPGLHTAWTPPGVLF